VSAPSTFDDDPNGGIMGHMEDSMAAMDPTMTVQADPATSGKWEPIQYRCQHLPVHVALLHTGKVLTFGGTCNNRALLGHPRPAELWNPETGEIKTVDQDLEGDIFCAGHAFLPDGRLLVGGGTTGYDVKRNIFGQEVPIPPFQGSNQTYIFDPITERWTRDGDMSTGRWYPTLIMLADGRVVAVAGLTQYFPWVALRRIEIYAQGQGWQDLKGVDRWMPLYPRLHLLPDGRVFYSGSYNTHYTFPFSLREFPTSILNVDAGRWEGLGLPNKSEREEGATVMLPLAPPDYRPRILLMGGGTPGGTEAIADAEVIDLGETSPHWRTIAPMHHARYYVYATLLPDGKILALGGRSGTKGMDMPPDMPIPHQAAATIGQAMGDGSNGEVPHDSRAVLEPELFDPETERWTSMAPMMVDRLYHSNALLLPDGRVATFGNNPEPGVDELRIEIYHPPYLFRGFRPDLHSAPDDIAYGQEFEIESPEAGDVDSVVLIRPTVTTHCVNPEQRYVRLEFHRAGSDRLVVRVPSNANVVPPGYYMLFILVDGVPSVSKMVLIHR
jgi:Galactose oxidase-like, Early set domain/Kelch motif